MTPPPGKSLYLIMPRDGQDEKEVRSLDNQLEAMAGVGNLYVETLPAGVYFWRAFLTTSQHETLQGMKEVSKHANSHVAANIT